MRNDCADNRPRSVSTNSDQLLDGFAKKPNCKMGDNKIESYGVENDPADASAPTRLREPDTAYMGPRVAYDLRFLSNSRSDRRSMRPSAAGQHPLEPASLRSFSARGIGRIAVLIWHTEVSVDGAKAIGEVFAELRRQNFAEGLGFLTIIETKTDIRPPSAARHAIAQVLSDYGGDIRAAAIVYEGDGFKSTIVRSVITAINVASSTCFPNRVFSTTRHALDWLADELEEPALLAQLHAGVSQLRVTDSHVSGPMPLVR